MSKETMEWLNTMTLIGNTSERGDAWHKDSAYQGEEPNHYEKMIPVADVQRRLFNWFPIKTQSAALIPLTNPDEFSVTDDNGNVVYNKEMVNVYDANGNPLRDDKGNPIMLKPSENRVTIVRSDNYLDLGAFKKSYQPHDYNEWLIGVTSNVIGDELGILSAGLLRNGAQAWLEAAFPQAVYDEKSGLSFMPYILAYTSLDGSLATGFAANDMATVCDNTFTANRNAAAKRNMDARLRHTLYSNTSKKVEEIRGKLGILLENQRENTLEGIHKWLSVSLTDSEWAKVMNEVMPLPEDEKSKGFTRIANKQELLNHVYHNDSMVNVIEKSALRAMHAFNTYAHHYAETRGDAGRIQRNMEKTVKGGFEELDFSVMDAIAKVKEMPELVAV